jgi:hypothetical protein
MEKNIPHICRHTVYNPFGDFSVFSHFAPHNVGQVRDAHL